MPETIPCLWFDGQAEDAAHHYIGIFPNSKILDVSRYGSQAPGLEGSVMTVLFSLDGQKYLGLNGGDQFSFSEAISFQIMVTGQEETDHYWNALTDGGQESQCGWLKDKYGLSWQVVPAELISLMSDPDPERAARATQAMMKMKKIDVAELQRAADEVPSSA